MNRPCPVFDVGRSDEVELAEVEARAGPSGAAHYQLTTIVTLGVTPLGVCNPLHPVLHPFLLHQRNGFWLLEADDELG